MNCCEPYKISDILVLDEKIVLTVCNCDCLCDGQPFNFVICKCIPKFNGDCAPEVTIKCGDAEFPLVGKRNCFGMLNSDKVYANLLRPRKVYKGIYGNQPEHVLCYNI